MPTPEVAAAARREKRPPNAVLSRLQRPARAGAATREAVVFAVADPATRYLSAEPVVGALRIREEGSGRAMSAKDERSPGVAGAADPEVLRGRRAMEAIRTETFDCDLDSISVHHNP